MKTQKALLENGGAEIWIRLPTHGQCPRTGLSRAKYYELINAGKIKSASLKEPGKLTGVRLVWLPSVMGYIERHVTMGAA
jgi:hypothetical protein